MRNDYDVLKDMISFIAKKIIKYAVPRLGQVLKIDDDDKKGRILVSIPAFGWTTQDTAQWCYPKDKRKLITPKKEDWVIVEWLDGEGDKIAVYSAIAYWMKDMLPKNYDGKSTTQLLFEDNNQELSIVYDEKEKIIKINHSKDEYSISWDKDALSIKDKENQSWLMDTKNKLCEFKSINSVKALLDGQNKIIELNDSVNKIKTDGNAGTIKLENQSGNIFEQGTSSTKINGTNLEVMI